DALAGAVAGVAGGARVAVVARGADGARRRGAQTGRRRARAHVVTLIQRRAGARRAAHALPGLTAIANRASVAVVARRAVGDWMLAAGAGAGVAAAGGVAGIGWLARHRGARDAGTSDAGVGERARIAVVAGTAIAQRRIAASAGGRAAGAG